MVVRLFICCVAHAQNSNKPMSNLTVFMVFCILFPALQKRPEDINRRSADMWSFAVLLWELVTREVPFADLSHMEIGMKVFIWLQVYTPCSCPRLCISWKQLQTQCPEARTGFCVWYTYSNFASHLPPRCLGGSRRSSANNSTGDFTSYLQADEALHERRPSQETQV